MYVTFKPQPLYHTKHEELQLLSDHDNELCTYAFSQGSSASSNLQQMET